MKMSDEGVGLESVGLEGVGFGRRRARLRAVQVLYMWSCVGKEDMGLVARWREEWFSEGSEIEEGEGAGALFEKMDFDEGLFYGIIEGSRGRGEGVRSFLEENVGSGGREFGGVSVLLRCIMQAALYELSTVKLGGAESIVIADYVAVTDAFFGKGEVSLVNGLLSKVLKGRVDEQ